MRVVASAPMATKMRIDQLLDLVHGHPEASQADLEAMRSRVKQVRLLTYDGRPETPGGPEVRPIATLRVFEVALATDGTVFVTVDRAGLDALDAGDVTVLSSGEAPGSRLLH